jgi:hypothetical protein
MASRVVRARLDPDSEAALRILTAEGRTESEAVREALAESARRRLRRSELRAAAQRLADDPEDLAEVRRIREEMDEIAAPWPEP